MRIFKIRNFQKFMRKERMSDQQLIRAVTEIESGLLEGDLGGGVVKKGSQAVVAENVVATEASSLFVVMTGPSLCMDTQKMQ